ncbi:hypothetical protein D9615_009316 [Tricholomella constricta]|uniref:BTB domain-containing protein n=1 Tax=Tricholomella constricta TaxID=117010 RepID=A0A8H5GWQ6_9AGAR|nr:hypothetical protein D9615_009316 [Tricholomella constricta]
MTSSSASTSTSTAAPHINNAKKVPHDDEYYLEPIIFLVEGHLFSVPRHYFASASDIFSTTFSLPPGQGKSQEGSSDASPFVLQGISRADFKGLLRVMYPLQMPHLGGEVTLPRKDWVAALKLSTMWSFRNIRQLAIARLSSPTSSSSSTSTSTSTSASASASTDPVEKVLLAKAYKVPEWLLSGYHELVKRSAPLTTAEAARLGLETTVQLFRVREEISSAEATYYNGYIRRREDQNFVEQVKKAFRKELKEVEDAHGVYNSLPAVYPADDSESCK